MPPRLAVDIGGTFTDVALELGAGYVTAKVLTTYDDPARGVLAGIADVLAQSKVRPEDIGLLVHGTTLATNALIERKGAKTALLTTAGHRDAVEIAYENRFEQYDINIDRPVPLVPRFLRLPIQERVDKDGNVLIPLDEATVYDAIETLQTHQVESVAVGLIHGYANADHERRIGVILQENLPDLSVTLASDVCPEVREYERLSTACANAYVKPLMSSYLISLEKQLINKGFSGSILLMTSGGGLTTLEAAREAPIRLVESGPAGGAILAQSVASQCDIDRAVSFDMGGTTAKLCLLDDGKPSTSRTFEVDRVYRFKKGSGLPVRIPVIEMVEIGAGGGSIATVDNLQRIQVGPESAGSEPGPAAYGRGGTAATVTDADTVLGKLSPERFAGGALTLSVDAAKTAVDGAVASSLDLDVDVAAFGISEIVDENMAAATRSHALEWGREVEHRTLIAFGGAAPLHTARLATKLGIDRVVIPKNAGVGSAIGFLIAPVAFEVVRSRYQLLSRYDAELVAGLIAEMEEEAQQVVAHAASDAELARRVQAFMRYRGQGYEIAVDLPDDVLAEATGSLLRRAFEAAYQNLYGRTIPDLDVEVLSWTLTLSTALRHAVKEKSVERRDAPAATSSAKIFDSDAEGWVGVELFSRDDLEPGTHIEGPAIIYEDQTTTVVPGDFDVTVNSLDYLVLSRRADS